ncbi:MAG: helix-turn-helix transcriptional regulator [Trebonia sp.]
MTEYFTGRADELTVLSDLLSGLRAGAGHAVLAEGEQGIGKSALLRRALRGAGTQDVRVLWGTADELGQQIPLLLIRECLSLGVQSRPEPESRPDTDERRGAIPGPLPLADPVLAESERLLAEVDGLCAVSPVILVTEDIQWADDASLIVWQRLALAAGQMPLLLVGSCRRGVDREEVSRLRRGLRARAGTVLSLGPLPAGHLPDLIADVLGAQPDRPLVERLRVAGGNPLYVRELADALRREREVTTENGVARLTAPESSHDRMPPSLAEAIADRLGGLPEEMVAVLRWAAVLGQEFDVTDLEIVTGRSAVDLAHVLDAALDMGIVTEAGAKLAFRHALLRQQLREGVPPARLLHSQAAQALAHAGARPEQVAAQLAMAGEWSQTWIRDWLVQAVPVLAYRMPLMTMQLLPGVLETMPESAAEWAPLQAALLTVAFLLGRYEQVQQAGVQLLTRDGDPDLLAEVAWLMAYARLRSGQPQAGIDVLREAVARPAASSAWRARLHALQALMLTMARQLEQAAEIAGEVLDGEEASDPLAAGYALHALSHVSFVHRDIPAALDQIDRALVLVGDADQSTDLRLMLLANQGAALGLLDRRADATASAGRALLIAERAGTSRLAAIRCTLAFQQFESGEWDDALAVLEQVIDSGPGTSSMLAHGLIALIAAYRDDGETAGEHLAAVSGQAAQATAQASNGHYLHLARGVAAAQAGRPDDALTVLADCLTPAVAMRMPARHLLFPTMVRLALSTGDKDTAQAAVGAAEDEAERSPLPPKRAIAGHCRGLLAGDPALVLTAAGYYESVDSLLLRAEALTDAAALLAAAGAVPAARENFDAAIGLYGGLDARWAIQSAAERLRDYGIRPRSGRYRARPSRGWGSLTPTEAKIARLIADGRSNPEIASELFLSRNTVQTHVSHILAKFGARSRTQIIPEVPFIPEVP